LLSADTWTLVAILLRNVLLNWLVLVPLLTAPLLVPLLTVAHWPSAGTDTRRLLFISAYLLEAVGLFFVSRFRDTGKDAGAVKSASAQDAGPSRAERAANPKQARAERGPAYLRLGLLPRLAALPPLLLGFFLYLHPAAPQPRPMPTLSGLLPYCLVWAVGLPLVALFASGPLLRRKVSALGWDSLSLLLAGTIEAVILAAVFAAWAPGLMTCGYPLYPILGPGLVIGPVLLGRTLFVAFSSVAEHWQTQRFGDADREWWARWSAWALISGVVWILGSALVLFAPTLLDSVPAQVAAVFSAGGLGGLVAFLGKSAATPATKDPKEGESGSRMMTLLLGVAVPLFIIAVVLCLSTGAQHLLASIEGSQWPPAATKSIDEVKAAGNLQLEVASTVPAGAPPQRLRTELQFKGARPARTWRYVAPYSGCIPIELGSIAALLLLGLLAGYPGNINRFSMQAGYRNRLIRAYLGASNAHRVPNLFTGFDAKDNVFLSELRWNRPLPVINMALNLVRGSNLAWQERKAESFTATPLHCGAAALGYRATETYGGQGGMTLGTALATSGAAANPNMGFNSSPAISFIMTLFTVRLGIWLGNPRISGDFAPYKRSGPRFSARVLLAEAFGWTDDSGPYVSLSDGGHFEDLGLYEMVRRRCRIILVCDAGADPGYGFKDLGNAIRKVRIDFGIPIVFTKRLYILPKLASGQAASGQARYCAVAEIRYSAVDKIGALGTLIYIKPSICEQPEPPTPFDVANYARFSRDFPHETTADQWFTETQFESYRALGEDAVTAIAMTKERSCDSLQELVRRVTEEYLPQSETKGEARRVAE
jgi:hypothetical protein